MNLDRKEPRQKQQKLGYTNTFRLAHNKNQLIVPKKLNKNFEEYRESKRALEIEKLENYAMEYLGIPYVNYKKMDIKIARKVNSQLEVMLSKYPQIYISWVSTIQKRNKAIFKETIKFYKKSANKLKYRKIVNSLVKSMKLDNDIVAEAYINESRYWGISLNSLWTRNIKIIEDTTGDEEFYKENGCFETVGNKVEDHITHEFGHLVHTHLQNNHLDSGLLDIYDFYFEEGEDFIKSELSGYGAQDYDEFVAEAFCEYHRCENPREIALAVGREIDRILVLGSCAYI